MERLARAVSAGAKDGRHNSKAMQPRSIGASRERGKEASGLRPHAYHYRLPRLQRPLGDGGWGWGIDRMGESSVR